MDTQHLGCSIYFSHHGWCGLNMPYWDIYWEIPWWNSSKNVWLVVYGWFMAPWSGLWISHHNYWEFHHPNWLSMTFIFFRGVETTNEKMLKFLKECPCFQYHGMLDDGWWMIFMDFPYWESRHVKTHVVLRVKIFSLANPVKHVWHLSHKTYTHHKPWVLKWC